MNTNLALQPAVQEVPLFRPAWSKPVANVVAACSTRHGGLSRPPFDSLNLSLHVGDDRWTVLENRRRFGRAANVPADRFVCAGQVHGADVAIIHAADAGRGSTEPDPFLLADALVTDTHDVPLLASVADCLPVFLAVPDGRAVGVVHAGWRSILSGVVENAVRELARLTRVDSRELAVAFGPSIGPCCFEVGDDVSVRFVERFGREGIVSRGPSRRDHVDLRAAALRALARVDVDGRVVTPPCTRCEVARFFSHRARGGERSGRMMAVIMRSRAT